MGSCQRQRSRLTAGIEPYIKEWKAYNKERAGKRLKRERERWEKRYMWTKDQNIKMGFVNIPLASSLFCPC